MVLKQPQYDAPHKGGKQGEGVLSGLGDDAFLHSQTGQGKQDPRQQVHVDLVETKTTAEKLCSLSRLNGYVLIV